MMTLHSGPMAFNGVAQPLFPIGRPAPGSQTSDVKEGVPEGQVDTKHQLTGQTPAVN